MFRALICPSSGFCDYVVELPHWLFRSWFAVCWSWGAVRLGWYPGCRLEAVQEQCSQCGSSTTQSQTPEDGHINARNMLNI